jgi:ribosomal protein L13
VISLETAQRWLIGAAAIAVALGKLLSTVAEALRKRKDLGTPEQRGKGVDE